MHSARNQEIVRLFVEEGWTDSQLASEYGLQRQTIQLIRKRAGITAQDRKKQPHRDRLYEHPAISSLHSQVGHRISALIHMHEGMKIKEFADKSGISFQRLARLIHGHYDPTLLELQRIMSVLQITWNTLFDHNVTLKSSKEASEEIAA